MTGMGSLSKFGALAAVAAASALIAGCGSSNSATGGGGGVTGGKVGNSTFADAANASASAAGEKLEYTMTSSGSQPFSISGTGAFNRSPVTGSMDMSINADGHNIDGVSIVLANDTMYLKFPSSLAGELSSVTGGKAWMEISIKQLGSAEGNPELGELFNGSETNPAQELKLLADSSTNGLTKVASATINGVSTTEYKATLDLSKEASAVPSSEQGAIKQVLANAKKELGTTNVPVQVWIDSNNLIRQLTMAMTIKADGQTLPMTMKLDILNYGKQSVTSPPPASQTYNISSLLSSASSLTGSSGG